MRKTGLKSALVLIAVLVSAVAMAGSTRIAVRATELNAKLWSDLEQGVIQQIVIEFRQGDRLPVTLQAEGDLIETTEMNPSYVVVKQQFWLKVKNKDILMSLDGTTFQPIPQTVKGSLTVNASGTGAVNAINMLFKAYLKH